MCVYGMMVAGGEGGGIGNTFSTRQTLGLSLSFLPPPAGVFKGSARLTKKKNKTSV